MFNTNNDELGSENLVAWSLKLEHVTFDTYLVRLLLHRVKGPPLPLPLETWLELFTAGSMNIS